MTPAWWAICGFLFGTDLALGWALMAWAVRLARRALWERKFARLMTEARAQGLSLNVHRMRVVK